MKWPLTRRKFLARAGSVLGAAMVVPRHFLCGGPEPPPSEKLRLGLVAKRAERFHLLGGQPARLGVDHAQGAKGIAVRRDQRCPRVEPDVGLAGDEGVFAKAVVLAGVRDLEDASGLLDRMGAERHRPFGLPEADAPFRFEPLPVLVDEGDEGHRRATDLRGEQGQIVECRLGLGVEDAVAAKGRQAGLFIDCRHASPREWLLNDTREAGRWFCPSTDESAQ